MLVSILISWERPLGINFLENYSLNQVNFEEYKVRI